jgi:hypothetical protein
MNDAEQLIREIAGDVRPVRRIPSVTLRWVVWLALAAASLATLAALEARRAGGLAGLATAGTVRDVVLLLAAAALAAWTCLALAVPGRASSPALRWTPAVLLGVWIAVVAFAAAGDANGCGSGIACVLTTLLVAAPSAAALYVLNRRAAATRPLWLGALLTGAAAAVGAAGARLCCAGDAPLHLLVWHALPAMGLAVSGLLIGHYAFARWFRRAVAPACNHPRSRCAE